MPVHDWSHVEAGIVHDLHTAWVTAIRNALNEGLLPNGYYALAEQHAGRLLTDVLTLHVSPEPWEPLPSQPADTGGVAVAEAPPRVHRKQAIEAEALARTRSLAIRHVSGHRLVALVEIISPANKDRADSVHNLVAKAVAALQRNVHLLFVDLFAPGAHDPRGMHGSILQALDQFAEPYDAPASAPFTLASYASGPRIDVELAHIAVGDVLPKMPLFLNLDRRVPMPLERTYQESCRGMPAFWREFLEHPPE